MDDDIDETETEDASEIEEPLPPPPATLAGSPLELRVPPDVAERWDIYLAGLRCPEISYLRVYAAAIALCWPSFRRVLAKANIVYDGNVVRFGGRIQHLLFAGRPPVAEPVDAVAFRAAGAVACRMIRETIVGGEAVAARRDFTSAPAEGRSR